MFYVSDRFVKRSVVPFKHISVFTTLAVSVIPSESNQKSVAPPTENIRHIIQTFL